MKKIALLLGCFALTTFSSASYNGWTYQRAITISSSNVSNVYGTLTNFPVIISTAAVYMSTASAGGHMTSAYDLGFFSDNNCQFSLNWDTETVNNTGSATENVWVQVPTLSTATATAATIYMCYGNASITSYVGNSTRTWSQGYQNVYHFASSNTLTVNDSVGSSSGTVVGVTAASNFIDGSIASTVGANYVVLSTKTAAFFSSPNWTISMWVYFTSSPSAWGLWGWLGTPTSAPIFQANGYCGGLSPFVARGTCGIEASATSNGAWHLITTAVSGVYSSNTNTFTTLYVDGVNVGSTSLDWNYGGYFGVAGNVIIGGDNSYANNGIGGYFDEVHFTTNTQNADWVKTEYNSQFAPSTFVTIGAETQTAPSGNAFWFGE